MQGDVDVFLFQSGHLESENIFAIALDPADIQRSALKFWISEHFSEHSPVHARTNHGRLRLLALPRGDGLAAVRARTRGEGEQVLVEVAEARERSLEGSVEEGHLLCGVAAAPCQW